MPECRCIIYHPQTETERDTVHSQMDVAWQAGDTEGILVAAVALLGYCPARDRAPHPSDWECDCGSRHPAEEPCPVFGLRGNGDEHAAGAYLRVTAGTYSLSPHRTSP